MIAGMAFGVTGFLVSTCRKSCIYPKQITPAGPEPAFRSCAVIDRFADAGDSSRLFQRKIGIPPGCLRQSP